MKKYSIEDLCKLAQEKKGLCLSNQYLGAHNKLTWQCEKGHVWNAEPNQIRKGNWCPYCRGMYRTIRDMYEFAEKKSGKCLSTEYIDSITKLEWECKKEHRWLATPQKIFQGRWCPECKKINVGDSKRSNIDEMHRIAAKKGWKCLSDKYINSQSKLTWQCEKGHIWDAIPASINRGYGCPNCAGKNPSIEDFKLIAINKGGKCLSEEYISSSNHLLWECEVGHKWEATPNMIKRRTWCPICSSFLSERICRAYFENIFKSQFPKNKPKWLVNSLGNRMELDGYSENLKIAFEYNGIQHYYKVKKFIDTDQELEKRKKDDKIKNDLCNQNGIKLFIIDYRTKYDKIPKVIKQLSELFGINTNCYNFNVNIDINSLSSPKFLKEAQKLAALKNGKCLSGKITTTKEKIIWECGKNHIWKSPLHRIKQGHWCPYCGGSAKHSYEFVKQQIEKEQEYTLISKEYINANEKILIYHKKCGREYQVRFAGWSLGYRCPNCSVKKRAEKQKLSYDFVKSKIENENDYKLLSEIYVNANSKIKILHTKCGQEFQTKYSKWYLGNRCPYCSNKRVYSGNSLKTMNPFLSKEWHPNKNENLTPEDVLPGTHRKVWWLCEKK